MQSRIGQLMGIDYKFDLMLSEDGSGRGAALVAAVLKREETQWQLAADDSLNNDLNDEVFVVASWKRRDATRCDDKIYYFKNYGEL